MLLLPCSRRCFVIHPCLIQGQSSAYDLWLYPVHGRPNSERSQTPRQLHSLGLQRNPTLFAESCQAMIGQALHFRSKFHHLRRIASLSMVELELVLRISQVQIIQGRHSGESDINQLLFLPFLVLVHVLRKSLFLRFVHSSSTSTIHWKLDRLTFHVSENNIC